MGKGVLKCSRNRPVRTLSLHQTSKDAPRRFQHCWDRGSPGPIPDTHTNAGDNLRNNPVTPFGLFQERQTAFVDFQLSQFVDFDSSDDLKRAVIHQLPCSLSSCNSAWVCCPLDTCSRFGNVPRDGNWDAMVAEMILKDCQSRDGGSPIDATSSVCKRRDPSHFSCWVLHYRRAEHDYNTLPALLYPLLQQWVADRDLDPSVTPGTNSSSPEFPISALHICAALGFFVLARILLEMSYNPNALAQPGGQTALHLASAGGHTRVIRLLLNWGADKEAKTAATKRTALQIAAFRGHGKVCRVIVNSGANLAATDHRGQTAEDIARSCGHSEIVDFLSRAGRTKTELDTVAPVEQKPSAHTAGKAGWVVSDAAGRTSSRRNQDSASTYAASYSASISSADSYVESGYETGATSDYDSWEEVDAASQHISWQGAC